VSSVRSIAARISVPRSMAPTPVRRTISVAAADQASEPSQEPATPATAKSQMGAPRCRKRL
jgi:hypothetical protein